MNAAIKFLLIAIFLTFVGLVVLKSYEYCQHFFSEYEFVFINPLRYYDGSTTSLLGSEYPSGAYQLPPTAENEVKKPNLDSRPSIDSYAIERRVFELTNEFRSENGLEPLQYDSLLSEIARAHSVDMAENNFQSHINLRGENPNDRANKRGYVCKREIEGKTGYGIAEVIAGGTMYKTKEMVSSGYYYVWATPEEIAQRALYTWETSPAHRKRLLSTEHKKMGTGVGVGTENIYFTQNFC